MGNGFMNLQCIVNAFFLYMTQMINDFSVHNSKKGLIGCFKNSEAYIILRKIRNLVVYSVPQSTLPKKKNPEGLSMWTCQEPERRIQGLTREPPEVIKSFQVEGSTKNLVYPVLLFYKRYIFLYSLYSEGEDVRVIINVFQKTWAKGL